MPVSKRPARGRGRWFASIFLSLMPSAGAQESVAMENASADAASSIAAPTPATEEAPPPAAPALLVAPAPEASAIVEAPPHPTVTAEWGQGLVFHSDDGTFRLQVRGRLQAQAFVETATERDAASVDFMARRARLTFRASLREPSIELYVQLGLAPRDMEPDLLIPLRDANVAWTGVRDFNVRIGVMKVPFSRERVISSANLQLVDRSIVNAELSLDRDNGIQLYSNDLFGLDGRLGYQLGVFGGDGRLRANNDLGLLYVARLQLQPFGGFDDSYIESDLSREESPRLSLGAGVAYNQDTSRRRRTTTDFYRGARFDYWHGQADALFKFGGFSLHAEVLLRHADGPSEITSIVDGMEVTERAGNAAGWFVQAGFVLPFPLEIAARYAEVRPLGFVTANHLQQELTVGLNWFFEGHDLKLQLDGSWLASERDAALEERLQARLQMQAHF